MPIQAVIFDVEGTLAETAELRRAAINQMFDIFELGLVWSRGQFLELHQTAPPEGELHQFMSATHPKRFDALKASGVWKKMLNCQRDIYLEMLEAGVAPLRPGVARLLEDALSSGLKIAVCGTGPRQVYESLIFNHFGLEMLAHLTASTAWEDLQGRGPTYAYALVRQRLGVSVKSTVVIEDSAHGVQAARGLGFHTIATPSLYRLSEKPAADLVISDLGHPAAPFSVMCGQARGVGHISVAALNELFDPVLQESKTAA